MIRIGVLFLSLLIAASARAALINNSDGFWSEWSEATFARAAREQKFVVVSRVAYTKEHVKELRAHSKAKTPVEKVAKAMKRSVGSVRQKAMKLGFGLGHQR